MNHVTANTVKHRHANIHKAFAYAYKTDLIQSNPADKVELPKIEKYSGQFYNQKQIENLIRVVKGDPIEFGVITASFYGLRRSEVLGLKWDAIDFENKTITIRHTVHEVTIDGKTRIVASDTTKTKSSYRSLPLVKPFEEILLKMKREQEENKRLCGRCYCQDYLDYIYVNQIGEIVKPGFVTAHFSAVLKANNLPHIRFHDLRHSCASLLFAQGVSLKEIQAWLGHSTIGTTANIYTHYVLEDDAELEPFVKAADKLSAHIKCLEEQKAGNTEFDSAAQQTLDALKAMNSPELEWFLNNCLQAFTLNLDQL